MASDKTGTAPLFECPTCCKSFTVELFRVHDRIICPHCGAHYVQEVDGTESSASPISRPDASNTPQSSE